MNDLSEHHGVTEDVVCQLGKITLSAAWVEHIAREIANAYNAADTHKMQFHRLTETIKERIRWPGPPPWSRTSSDDVLTWLVDAKQVMNRRNEYLHALPAKVSVNGAWMNVSINAKSGQQLSHDADVLAEISSQLKEVIEAGEPLRYGLLPMVKDGVYLQNYPLTRDGAVLFVQIGDAYPEATEAEIEEARVRHNEMLGTALAPMITTVYCPTWCAAHVELTNGAPADHRVIHTRALDAGVSLGRSDLAHADSGKSPIGETRVLVSGAIDLTPGEARKLAEALIEAAETAWS